jgi:acyl carrier protein
VELQELRHVVALALNVDDSEVGDDASMDTVGAWDSLRHLYVVMAVEEAFGITFDDAEAVTVTSLALLREALERRGLTLTS